MTDLTRAVPGPQDDPDEGPEATPEQEASARALLAALPPAAMPADVWARLAASLAAEPPLVGTAAEPPLVGTAAEPPLVGTSAQPAAAGTTAPVADLAAARGRRGRGQRWLGAVAGVAAAAVAVAVGVQVMGRPSSSEVAGSAAAASSAPQQDRLTPEVAAVPVVASGTTYQQASFADQASAVARAATPSGDSGTTTAPGPGSPETPATPATGLKSAADTDTAGTFAATPEGVRDCAVAVSGTTTVRVLVVDLATYAGRPVAVLVLARTDPALDAWVVGRGCASGDPQVVAHQQLPLR